MGGGEILGFQEKGEGPVLLAIHGFPFDRRMWTEQLRGLADIRRVVAVDLRGRGRSAGIDPGGATLDRYADDVAATIRALEVAQADIAGLSMGGYVAFSLWRRHPELVRSMILAATRAGPDTPEGKQARDANAELVRAGGTSALAEAMLFKLLAPTTGEQVRRRVREMFEETPARSAMADLLAMRDRLDSTATLPTISVPSLVLRGDDDALIPADEARALAGAIPGARLVEVPRAGHLVPLENPGAANGAIRLWLTSSSPAGGP